MPQFCMNKMIRVIRNNNEMKDILGLNNEQIENEKDKDNNNKGKKKRNIKNIKMNNMEFNKLTNRIDYIGTKNNIELELRKINQFYIKKVLIYFIISFFVLGLNWYMMTSFCAIFINTGIKLI